MMSKESAQKYELEPDSDTVGLSQYAQTVISAVWPPGHFNKTTAKLKVNNAFSRITTR